jgi:predicted nucleotide-binding protein
VPEQYLTILHLIVGKIFIDPTEIEGNGGPEFPQIIIPASLCLHKLRDHFPSATPKEQNFAIGENHIDLFYQARGEKRKIADGKLRNFHPLISSDFSTRLTIEFPLNRSAIEIMEQKRDGDLRISLELHFEADPQPSPNAILIERSLANADFSFRIPQSDWENKIRPALGYEVAVHKLPSVSADSISPVPPNRLGQGVFVVHGHDEGTKDAVSRFIEKLGLKPIILDEQPDAGRTIIEKFEAYSNVGFAVILLTPDDVGAAHAEATEFQARARQNVIFEFGYFVGKLGRQRICVLYKESLEIPSDFVGVLYIPMDNAGTWRTRLAKEMKEASLAVDLNKAL